MHSHTAPPTRRPWVVFPTPAIQARIPIACASTRYETIMPSKNLGGDIAALSSATFASLQPWALIHGLLKSGPYHRPPTQNAASAATITARQLISLRLMFGIVVSLSRGVDFTANVATSGGTDGLVLLRSRPG